MVYYAEYSDLLIRDSMFFVTLQWQNISAVYVKLPVNQVFIQHDKQVKKENIKSQNYRLFVEEITSHQWIPLTNGYLRKKHFYVMTLSWSNFKPLI